MMYERLYRTVDEKLRSYGKKLPIRECVACAIYGKNPWLVDADEFEGVAEEDFLEYVHYRCLNGMPDEETYKLFYSEEQKGQFKNEAAFRLFIILSITQSELFSDNHKELKGLDSYWKRLRKERRISVKESIKLQSIGGNETLATQLYENLLHPVRKILPF